ncbi:MAG: hypothetical protein R2835_05700 [Thermomicrobiales bacterium]
MRGVEVVGHAGDMMDAMQPHLIGRRGDRLRPGLGADRIFVASFRESARRRNHEIPAQRVGWFVDLKTRAVGGDFDHLPVGIGEIDAREVAAVIWPGDANTVVGQPTFPHEQGVVVPGAERDMVDPTHTIPTAHRLRPFEEREQ